MRHTRRLEAHCERELDASPTEHPPELAPPPSPVATHAPDSSHALGGVQSSAVAHFVAHAPALQTYGAQGSDDDELAPGAMTSRPSDVHVALLTQAPATHRLGGAQSSAVVHTLLHAPLAQA
jgi:hypothetical protein